MSMLAILTNPLLFIAVMAATLCILLHISIRNEGLRPAFRQYRIRRTLVVTLLSWALAVLIAHGAGL